MEQRIYQVEKDQFELRKRLDSLEKERQGNDFLIKDIAHKSTIAVGLATTTLQEMQDFKIAMQSRLERIDDRVTEAHKELAELRLSMATKDDISSLKDDISFLKNDFSFLKNDFSSIKNDFSSIKTTQQRQEQLLQAILDRLPPKQ